MSFYAPEDRRSEKREELRIPIVLKGLNICEETESINVGFQGICIFSQKLNETDVGKEVNLSFSCPKKSSLKKLSSTLSWLDNKDISGRKRAGLRFNQEGSLRLLTTSLNIMCSISKEQEQGLQGSLYEQMLYVSSRTQSLKDVYRAILEAVGNLCNLEASILKIYDSTNDELAVCEKLNLRNQDIGKRWIKVKNCPCKHSLKANPPTPIKTKFTSENHPCFSQEFFDSRDNSTDRYIWDIPILGKNKELVGTVCCVFNINDNITEKAAIDLQRFVSAAIAFVEKAFAQEVIQKVLQVAKTKELITSEKFLTELAKSIGEVMSTESCSILFIDELNKEKLSLVGSTRDDWEQLPEEKRIYDLSSPAWEKQLTSKAVTENQLIICNDPDEWHKKHKSEAHVRDIIDGRGRTFICTPLKDEHGRAKGAIRCSNKVAHKEDEPLVNCFSRYDGVILEHLAIISELLYGLFARYEEMIKFITVATHEIGNPLHFFKGALQALRGTLKKEREVNKYILNLLDGLEGSSNLLNVLNANWTVLLKEQSPSVLRACGLYGGVITKVVGMLRPRCNYYGIKIEYDDIKNLPDTIYVDPLAFQQVFYNVLINSIKYEGGIEKPIKIIGQSLADRMMITIFDNGIGIPEGEEETIFDYQQRGSNAKDLNQRGQGLGLYVCRRILSRYGANIYVVNCQHPTLFAIELPKNLLDANWFEKGIPQLRKLKSIKR